MSQSLLNCLSDVGFMMNFEYNEFDSNLSDTHSFSQSPNSPCLLSNPSSNPYISPSNLQRSRDPLCHPLIHNTLPTISPELPSDTMYDKFLDADGDMEDELLDQLSSIQLLYHQAHCRLCSEIKMPAARPAVNPALSLVNVGELITSMVNEYNLSQEHKSAFERIVQVCYLFFTITIIDMLS